MNYTLRVACEHDIPILKRMIEESTKGLCTEFYTPVQIDLALQSALGVDSQLIDDKTYFCIEAQGEIIACGGWSYRATLFGSDDEQSRNATELDPDTQAAKIRAFFVKPDHARQGIGSMLLKKCETEAICRGYRTLELMATLPGVKLYERHGFVAGETVEYNLGEGTHITFMPMSKRLERF
ncbi:GNAT family N-acetyltransferase [Pseudoalteromonas sp. SMS1]|uniref:GNAT family N-acetyltransferase n=1 Tax=Pseudoalteromonas sp. SMS1 TaxID=2908894 RepID=UPI001F1DC2E5|nr:GNAT family N-acetyltransferase [Pseudoalteromonas sp. SMS1]MCF2860282.1 GNAT family N-acetyltransferase [Pseudoalteromonas sp. SMS1]